MSLMNRINWILTFAVPFCITYTSLLGLLKERPTILMIQIGVKLLRRLQSSFSHQCEYKFRHGFRDILTSCLSK